MIYGDPFCFALQFDKVSYWNDTDNSWENGLFYCYINGKRIFEFIDVFELKTTFSFYAGMDINKLELIDNKIDYIELYENAENYFTGDGDKLINGLFNLTCTAMGDNGCYVYFCKTSENDQLIWSIDDGLTINQTLFPPKTIESVIKSLTN